MKKRSLVLALTLSGSVLAGKKPKVLPPSPLETYVRQATQRDVDAIVSGHSAGSLWSPGSVLSDLARDNRANQIDDIVTVIVSEQASAVSKGTTKSSRATAANNSVTALLGPQKATSKLANLTGLSGSSSLDGQGATTRDTTLTANISARVVQVLPNGNLVIEGAKSVQVNSDHQLITVHGVVRPADISTANTVPSIRVAEMEVRINGKGVVEDSIHRPFFLYRLLLGLLPF